MKKYYLFILFLFIFKYGYSQDGFAGPDKILPCTGGGVVIGDKSNDYTSCYFWKSTPNDPNLIDINLKTIRVNPAQTTTYTLTKIGIDFSSILTDDVIVTIPNNDFIQNDASVARVPPSSNLDNNVWGEVKLENIELHITACTYDNKWHAIVEDIVGNYSFQARLLTGVTEVTGIGGNTTQSNFCDQVTNLNLLSFDPHSWYMLDAIIAHEEIHESRAEPALEAVANQIELSFELLNITNTGQSEVIAISQIEALPAYQAAKVAAFQLWVSANHNLTLYDHSNTGIDGILDNTGLSYQAEISVVENMATLICNHANSNNWIHCPGCP